MSHLICLELAALPLWMALNVTCSKSVDTSEVPNKTITQGPENYGGSIRSFAIIREEGSICVPSYLYVIISIQSGRLQLSRDIRADEGSFKIAVYFCVSVNYS